MELLMTDTVGIQGYVFGSNRLRENVGGSYLVAQATGDWAFEALRAATGGRCNIAKDRTLDPNWTIEHQDDGGELIYSGGGNVLALFQTASARENFLRILSKRLTEEAPELELVAASIPFDWARDQLRDKLDELTLKLATKKRERPRYLPLAGLGVSRACQATGLPAIGAVPIPTSDGETEERIASAEILAKLAATKPGSDNRSAAERRLYALVGDSLPPRFRFPRDIEDLGGTHGENSYMAVVHADGDGMSERLRQAVRQPGLDGPRDQIKALRDFSAAVEQAGATALKTMVKALADRIDQASGRLSHSHSDKKDLHIDLRKVKSRSPADQDVAWYLPFRPLVFGGDDLTFVCDGRLGLSLAQVFLEQFKAHAANLPGGGTTASAGVAIAKAGRPFARTYAMAEELCRSAKDYRRETQQQNPCLDWYFTATSANRGIKRIREREYQAAVTRDPLYLRPVELTDDTPYCQGRTWQTLETVLHAFQGEKWRHRRNKVKALREALRQGDPDTIHWFRTKYLEGGELPPVPNGRANWPTEGWDGELCGYFDAIELIDHYIPL